jgi:hypothetical protein
MMYALSTRQICPKERHVGAPRRVLPFLKGGVQHHCNALNRSCNSRDQNHLYRVRMLQEQMLMHAAMLEQ